VPFSVIIYQVFVFYDIQNGTSNGKKPAILIVRTYFQGTYSSTSK